MWCLATDSGPLAGMMIPLKAQHASRQCTIPNKQTHRAQQLETGAPLPPEDYERKLHELAAWLLQLQAQGKRVYFHLMPSFGLRKRIHHDSFLEASEGAVSAFNSTADYRTEPLIIKYNAIAAHVMHAQYKIPLVDFHSPTAPMSDLTPDRAHFIGSVGQAVNQMLVSVLCPDEVDRAVALYEGPAGVFPHSTPQYTLHTVHTL